MIRPVAPLDVFRCALLGTLEGPSRACTLTSLSAGKPSKSALAAVAMAAMGLRGRGSTWVERKRGRVVALVSVAQRSGPQSWEITYLLLGLRSDAQLPELLEKVSQRAVSNGGERVFLRLRRDDPAIDAARLSGFFPSLPQVLYAGAPQRLKGKGQRGFATGSGALRSKRQGDEHELFRLYNAATPSGIRHAVGVTFDQWLASRERCPGRRQEYVLERDGGVKGWLSVVRRRGSGHLAAMVHPDDERSMPSLVDFGLERLRGVKLVRCLAAEHQVALQRSLEWRGFRPESDYVTLVKSMAVKVREAARARATAAST